MSGGWREQSAGVGRPGKSRSSLKLKQLIWLTVTAAVAIVVAVLLSNVVGGGTAPVRLVAIGMSSNHPAFPARQSAMSSAAAFEELHRANERQFPKLPDMRQAELHGDRFLNGLKDRLTGSSDEILVVYLNCLGGLLPDGDKVTAQLITVNAEPDCLAKANDSELVSVTRLLELLADVSSNDVLVLFDGYIAPPNWRAGILSRDFTATLIHEAEIACNKHSNLHVICACDAGEATATMGVSIPSTYILGHFAVEGLKGDADGWARDPVTESTRYQEANQNGRVSLSELIAYLQHSVNEESTANLATTQTVKYFGNAFEQDREIVQIARLNAAAKAAAEAAAKTAVEDSGIEGEIKDKAAPVAETAGAKNSTPDKSKAEETEKGGEKSEDRKVAESENKEDAGASEKSKETERLALKSKLEALTTQLNTVWKQRDLMRKSSLPAVFNPHQWGQLNYSLVRVEKQLRLGEDKAAEAELLRASNLLNIIEEQSKRRYERFAGPLGATSLEALRLRTAAMATENVLEGKAAKAAEIEQAARLAAFDELWEELSQGMAEAKTVLAIQKLFEESTEIRSAFLKRVFQHALDIDLAVPGNFAAVNEILQMYSARETPDGMEPVPAELVILGRLCQVGAAVPNDSLAEFSVLCREALQLREAYESMALNAEPYFDLIKPAIVEMERRIIAAERWLSIGLPGKADARHWIDAAQDLLKEFQEETAPTIEQAVRFRAELLAELPAYAQWCARTADTKSTTARSRLKYLAANFAEFSWVAQDEFPREADELLLRGLEKRLLKLMAITRRLCAALDSNPTNLGELRQLMSGAANLRSTPDRNGLKSLVSELAPLWEDSGDSFRSGFLDEVEKLSTDVASASTRSLIFAALDVPWLPLRIRTQLLSRLEATSIRGFDSAKTVSGGVRDHGEWEAFWCLQTLSLVGLNESDAKNAWSEFQRMVNQNTSETQVAESARMGQTLTGIWNIFRESTKTYSGKSETNVQNSASAFELAYCIHPADDILSEAVDHVAVRYRDLSHQTADARAQSWNLRHRSYESLTGADALESAWIESLPDRQQPSGSPQLVGIVDSLRILPSQDGILNVSSIMGDRPETRVRLTFQSDTAVVRDGGRQVMQSGVDLDPAIQEYTHSFQVTLEEGTASRPQPLTVLLADRTDSFPWDIRHITVLPPLDPNDWRIIFVTPDEAEALTQSRQAASVASIRERHLDGKLKDSVDFRLPPNVVDAALKPILLPPPGTDINKIGVTISVIAPDKQTTATPLATINDISISADGQAVPLEIPATNAGAIPATPPPADTSGIDVTSGLVFEIRIPNEKPIRHTMHPVIRDAQDLITQPQVQFRDGLLTVKVRRSLSIQDPLVPLKFPVALQLPSEMNKLLPQVQLQGDTLGDKSLTLSARFTDASNFDRTEHPIFLSVAGVPHAYAWYVKHRALARALTNELLIDAPVTGVTVEQGEPVVVSLSVFTRQLEDSEQLSGWQIETRDKLVGFPGDPQTRVLPIEREHAHQVKLNFMDGVWNFQTTSSNHTIAIPTAGRTGVFEVRAKLVPPPGVPQNSRFERRVTFGVDDKSRPPQTPKLFSKTGFQGNGKMPDFLLDGKTVMQFSCEVFDAESGVEKVSWGFDKDGVAGDGVLAASEVISEQELHSDQPDPRTVRIKVAQTQIPQSEGIVVLLVSAVDGLGTPCRRPLSIPMNLRLPEKTGTLALTMKYFNLNSRTSGSHLELRRDGEPPVIVSKDRYAADLLQTLSVGKYKIVIVRNGNERQTGEVTITEGKRVSHLLEF